MSIFPVVSIAETVIAVSEESKAPHRTYAFDVEKGEYILQPNGKPIIIEGLDALRQHVQTALSTERYTYPIYTSDFGHELKELIQSDGTREWKQAEAERLVKEAVLYLRGVDECTNFTFRWSGTNLYIEFTVVTEEGEFTEEVST